MNTIYIYLFVLDSTVYEIIDISNTSLFLFLRTRGHS